MKLQNLLEERSGIKLERSGGQALDNGPTFATMNLDDLTKVDTIHNFNELLTSFFPNGQKRHEVAQLMYDRIDAVNEWEYQINPSKTLYLFTWSPDPGELPKCDFTLQHRYNVNIISDFLSVCSAGLACVESTQRGNPHYHGWYQISENPNHELQRIAIVKTMEHFGQLKITPSVGKYKYGNWSKHCNCLYYYKKELLDAQLLTPQNPICRFSKCDICWDGPNFKYFFHKEGKRETIAEMEDRITQREFYKQFYADSSTL